MSSEENALYRYSVSMATDIGLVRSLNEDSMLVLDNHTYIVADGMGGHAAGEVASKLLVDTAAEILSSKGFFDESGLKHVVEETNSRILAKTENNENMKGMGTTATMLHIEGNTGFWAHVGDSRIYILRNGILEQVTRDHSLVSDLVSNGSITPEEAKTHPKKNLLMRAVGVDEDVVIDTGVLPLNPGDRLLLCTDGLTNMVDTAEIRDVLGGTEESCNGREKAQVLIDMALKAGGRDNVTAIVVEYNV